MASKAEVIHRRGSWRTMEAVEFATLGWVDWFNNRRLLEPIGNIPPVEAEETLLRRGGRNRRGDVTKNKIASGNPGAVQCGIVGALMRLRTILNRSQRLRVKPR